MQKSKLRGSFHRLALFLRLVPGNMEQTIVKKVKR